MSNVNYTVVLTETEDKSLGYIAYDQQDWIDNVVHDRCRIAIDEIVKIVVQKCLETSVQIPGTKEEIVALGFANGWVKSAKDNHEETINNLANLST